VPSVTNPRFSYGGGKIACELAALAWQRQGILDRVVVIRPHNIYSDDMGTGHVIPQFCLRMNELAREHPGGVIPFRVQGTGSETRSFCHRDDCMDQLILLLERAPAGGNVFNAGNEDERTIADVAHAVAAAYGREVKLIPGALPEGSPPRRCPDISKIMALGYPGPKVRFEDGLAETVAWYRANQ